MNNRVFAIAVLSAMCITMILAVPTNSRVGYYDPWIDLNDDGKIDMKDVAEVAKAYGSLGDPINKTELLLDLQDRVEALEAKFPVTTSDIADYAVTDTKLADMAIPYWGGAWTAETSNTEYWAWNDIGSQVSLTVNQNSILLIMFSAEWYVEDPLPYVRCRAKIKGSPLNPAYLHFGLPTESYGSVVTSNPGWEWHSFMFIHYLTGKPDTYTVTMQWMLDSAGKAWARNKSLVVFALP